MPEAFTDDELATEATRARKLADLCFVHGMVDGGKAMNAVVAAIDQERVVRARKSPQ